MKIVRFLITVSLGIMQGMPLALAGGGTDDPAAARPPIQDAKAVIAACEKKFAKEAESGVTARMRAAAIDTAFCVREAIIENMVVLAGEKERANVRAHLERINEGIGRFYWLLYNDIDPCFRGSSIGCGTFWHVWHNAKVLDTYNRILVDVIEQRKRYKW